MLRECIILLFSIINEKAIAENWDLLGNSGNSMLYDVVVNDYIINRPGNLNPYGFWAHLQSVHAIDKLIWGWKDHSVWRRQALYLGNFNLFSLAKCRFQTVTSFKL